jgi:hypothetical protein
MKQASTNPQRVTALAAVDCIDRARRIVALNGAAVGRRIGLSGRRADDPALPVETRSPGGHTPPGPSLS